MKRKIILLATTLCLSVCVLGGCGSKNNDAGATQSASPANTSSASQSANSSGNNSSSSAPSA